MIRGVKSSAIGGVVIKGAASGVHAFTTRPDSDGFGASLVPAIPFTPGELVRVSTGLAIPRSTHGTWYFHVARPADDAPTGGPQYSDTASAQHFVSEPTLTPPVVTITTNTTSAAEGDLFLDSHSNTLQQGPEIVDPAGNLVWFHPIPYPLISTDFRVQTYQGAQVLTWWQGNDAVGHGYGEGEIYGTDYQPIAVVRAGNGYSTDPHEFSLTRFGTALVTIYSAVQWDLRPVGGAQDGTVLDSIVQEIDIATGNVLYEWHSLDHVAVSDTYRKLVAGAPFDYFHVNSVDKAANGNLLVSARHTSTVYDLDRTTGKVLWRLGGKHSDYKAAQGAAFSFQHNARWQADGTLTLFDNAVGAPTPDWRSHALQLRLDAKHHTVKAVRDLTFPNGLLAPTQGNVQLLPDHNVLVGYGERPLFAEYSPTGKLLLQGTLPATASSYRTYRYPWLGRPAQAPSLALVPGAAGTAASVSWNGTTQAASWQFLAGSSPSSLAVVATVPRTGFETTTTLPGAPAYAVAQALDAAGRLLGSSAVVASPAP